LRARLPILLLTLIIAAPLAGFLPRMLGERTPEPLDRRPSWVQLVVVTCDRLPAELGDVGPGLATLERRAARAALRAPVPTAAAAAAVSLWTGRRDALSDLAPGGPEPWSLAAAARRTGAASAAFLQSPLVSASGLGGFDRVVEDSALEPGHLLSLADEHLARHSGRRSVLWLHLADPGPRAERLDELLAGLHRVLEARGHRWDALVLVTALTADAGARLPLWAELPSALYAGRRGRGTAELTDVAGVLLQLLRLPAPDVTRGEAPIESTPDLTILLQGGAPGPRDAR